MIFRGMNMKNKKLLVTIVMAIVFIMVATSLTSFYQNDQKANPNNVNNGPSGTLYISPGPTPAFTDNFNPFNP